MNDSDLLDEFRALGGVADNVKIQEGLYGRGLFAVDPHLPVRVMVPERLLVRCDWLQLDDMGGIRLKKGIPFGVRQKQFTEAYYAHIGWTKEVVSDLFEAQTKIAGLPKNIKQLLISIGWTSNDFSMPDNKWCLDRYRRSRRLVRKGKPVLMPVVELTNHSAATKGFQLGTGVEVSGVFSGEVLVDYATRLDAVGMFRNYGFCELVQQAMSCPLEMGHPAFGKIVVSRIIGEANMADGSRMPKIRRDGDVFHISYLPIGDMQNPAKPKEIFLQLAQTAGLPLDVAETLFSRIVAENRRIYQALLLALEAMPDELAVEMQKMVQFQLAPIR